MTFISPTRDPENPSLIYILVYMHILIFVIFGPFFR